MRTGSDVGILGSFGLAVYAFATPHGPNRSAIAAIAVVGLIVASVARILPSERIIRSRWREAFLVLWSSISIFVVAVIAQLDGGVDSPATILFVLPVLFAALTSPLRVTIVVGIIDVTAFLSVAGASGDNLAYSSFTAFGLLCVAAISAFQARNQARRR